ncbi:MAG: MCP four helix bundle domain-containing protein, partial [Desulfuromonadales bacterium]
MGDLKIGVRLGLAFSALIMIMLVVGGYSLSRIHRMDGDIDVLLKDRYPKIMMLHSIKDNLSVIARALRNMLLLDAPDEIAKEAKRVTDSRDAISKIFTDLEKVIVTEQGKAQLKEVIYARTAYVQAYMNLIRSNSPLNVESSLTVNL